ncbi:MAG: hypothetical protein HQM10_03770 [Candidatus Riflebacteria bacterium]|nr:hypothetical protein [Candidatus Riflebacteria bacterium]
MAIKNLIRRELAVIGRIKIGGLESTKRKTAEGKEWQAPVKYDHFQIKTMDRGQDGNFLVDQALQEKIGEKPRELEIMLLYNDNELNFRTEMAWYQGRKCLCRGDGEKAQRIDYDKKTVTEICCPCSKKDEPRGCKPHGTLLCILKDAEIAGGVWKFSTTSWNTIANIQSSLDFISLCAGGKLAGIPLSMRLYQKEAMTPDGSPTKIWIVGLFYKGSPVQMLENAIVNEKRRLEAGIKLELLEYQVRNQMQNEIRSIDEIGPTDPDELEEFHPEHEVEKPSIKDVLTNVSNPQEATTEKKTVSGQNENTDKNNVPENVTEKPVVNETTTQAANQNSDASETKLTKNDMLKEIALVRTKSGVTTGQFIMLVGAVPGCKAGTDSKVWTDDQTAMILQKLKEKYPTPQGAAA